MQRVWNRKAGSLYHGMAIGFEAPNAIAWLVPDRRMESFA
jgi:hypothetical protein